MTVLLLHFSSFFFFSLINVIASKINHNLPLNKKHPEITAKLQKFVAATISFREIIESGHYFADKSNLIYAMSSYVNTIFCRPRRFGKTTFHQMLQEYYDIKNAKTEDFEKVFFLFTN